MADPEEYRTKEEVEEWRTRDPILTFGARLREDGIASDDDIEEMDKEALATVDQAVEFAEASPFPELASLYDDIYVYGEQVRGWYSVDERSPEPHRGEKERDSGVIAHELAEAGAAYAGVGDQQERSRRQRPDSGADGEGEPAADTRDDEGGGD